MVSKWRFIAFLQLLGVLVLCAVSPLLAGEVEETGLNSYADPVMGADISGTEILETTETYQVTAAGDVTESYGDVSVTAYGIYADTGDTVSLISGGDIDVAATGGNAAASANATAGAAAAGIHLSDGAVVNDGDVTVSATGGKASSDIASAVVDAYADGIYARGETLENSGTVSVTADGGTGSGSLIVHAYAGANGLYGDSDNGLTNSGDIRVLVTGGGNTGETLAALSFATAYGIYADNGGDVTNSGAVEVEADGGRATDASSTAYAGADARGIYAYGRSSVENSGAVTATASGGTAAGEATAHAAADARGIYAYSNDHVSNSGDIMVTAAGGTATSTYYSYGGAAAYGIYGEDVATLENSGALTVTATGGTASTSVAIADAGTDAMGIFASGTDGLVNSGAITVTAVAGSADAGDESATAEAAAAATGIRITGGGTVTNSGAITAVTTGDGGSAVGILFEDGGYLTHTGIIDTRGDSAHQAAVASGTLTLVDVFNMSLGNDPEDGAIQVGEDASVDINDARLTLSYSDADIVLDAPYRLFEADTMDAVAGAFSRESFSDHRNPNVRIDYLDMGTTGAADDAVSISWSPVASPFLMGFDYVRRHFAAATAAVNDRLGERFLDAGLRVSGDELVRETVAGDWTGTAAGMPAGETDGVYVTPYLERVEADPSAYMGYDAETTGISAGYERWIGEILCGLDVNLARTDLDVTGAGFEESREEIETKGIGLYAMGNYSENIVWRARLAGLWATHDYEGLTGIDLGTRESAGYESSGFVVTEMIGRLFFPGSGNVLLPEIGAEYIYLQREGFTTEATVSNWALADSRIGDNQIMGIASLRWLGRMKLRDMILVPSVSAGIRVLLTDEMIGETQTVGSSSTLVRIEQDKVAGTVAASCLLNITEAQHAELAYDGAFSGQAAQHALSVRWCMKF